ncbi:MAG: Unknown protein [uncultured Sulfurovum sp.]|uniref:Thioredoxin domain-containing protein n=1 Tax=uncultured Sulfurovum sp. TaxID=269237 RepID=A0A6S6RXW7_9BACT|nr:MAG: Unknown protein [uncultured Sulfurovum sp.]
MKKTLFLSSLLLIGLSTNACINKEVNLPTSPQVYEEQPTAVAPMPQAIPTPTAPVATAGESHQLKTVQGQIISIQERSNGLVFPGYPGKIILLQVFGQDCPYCFKEMPIINDIKRRYSSSLEIVALQAQEPMSNQVASNLIQKFQMYYPIIDKDEARPLLYLMNNTYSWNGVLPYTLLLKNGVTEYSFSGEVSHQELNEAVRSLL